jgi:tetratricopeptide (TPR) repeat protein
MTDWLSAGGMILSGLIVGFMFWYGMKGRAVKPDVERLDLEAKRDLLLQQLRELKETGGSTEEQRRVEREAADVLRALDQHVEKRADKRRLDSPARPAEPSRTRESDLRAATIRGFVWGAASVAVLGGIGWFVAEKATPKTETASAPMASAPQAQQPDPALQQIEAAVAKSPDDLEMRNQLAKAYLERENLMGVFEQTKYILAKSPDDARALTYQALVRMSMGQRDPAAQMLQHAIKSDPQLIDAYVALAWDDIQRGNTADAEVQIAEATRRHPEQKQRLDDVLSKMKEQAKNPAPAGAPSAPAAAPASGPSVHVTLTLAGAAPSPNAVLFVIARAAGQSAGPPAAVKRIAGPTFPLDIDLSAADSMMGQPLPATVRIEARLDSDGDAMTKNPSDPHAVQDGVATNGTKVSLALQ